MATGPVKLAQMEQSVPESQSKVKSFGTAEKMWPRLKRQALQQYFSNSTLATEVTNQWQFR